MAHMMQSCELVALSSSRFDHNFWSPGLSVALCRSSAQRQPPITARQCCSSKFEAAVAVVGWLGASRVDDLL